MIKWFAAFLGYYLFRFPGALLGFFIGGMIDRLNGNSGTIFRTKIFSSQPNKLQINLLALSATVITFLLLIMVVNKLPKFLKYLMNK